MTKSFNKAILVAAGLALVGSMAVPVTADATSYVCKYREKSSSKKGTVVGAIAGGLIGGSLADTHNKGLGTVGGAVAGGLIGSKVGRNHGKEDCLRETAYRESVSYTRDRHGVKHKVVTRYVYR